MSGYTMEWPRKLDLLEQIIAGRGSMLISFSGGVDSSLLAAIAKDILGDRSRCVFLDSPVVPRIALIQAEQIARELDIFLEIVPTPVMDDEKFRKNPLERCYICKKISARILKEKANESGMACIAEGINISDFGEHRPGLIASTEEGFIHPFVEAEITKKEIRDIARHYGYKFWNKPSSTCLSSRVPYGEEITPEKLMMIEHAETCLRERGFTQCRVRVHGRMARIEVQADEIPELIRIRKEITGRLRETGFTYVTLDLEGYRSGSMDEIR
jgi:pyridinium-3,5-biscarboxylic acid mononucleotide sulfurtransferase